MSIEFRYLCHCKLPVYRLEGHYEEWHAFNGELGIEVVWVVEKVQRSTIIGLEV